MTPNWTAQMIAPDQEYAGAPLLRGEFRLDAGAGLVTSARLLATARGIFQAYLDGQPVSDEVLSPGWSSYEWRLRYRDYDVTEAIQRAQQAGRPLVVGLALGNGWYRGSLGFLGNSRVYGEELGGLAQLELTFADGHQQVYRTDGTWRAGPSATVAHDLSQGPSIDARLYDDRWLFPAAERAGWSGVHGVAFDHATLCPYTGPVVRRQETVAPVRIWRAPSGRTLVDFGQNLVGWLRLHAHGTAGQMVTVRHAEVLEHEELGTRPLRTAEATDRFVLSGDPDTFEPTRTFHGFRYADIDGYPGELTPAAIEAVVVHSDLTRTGTFDCSDEALNQLHRNVVWSMRGNFLDLPTDCPQRDERLGWTGDIAVFAPTAVFLFNVAGFLDNWLADLAAEQLAAGGVVPFVVPDNLKYDTLPEVFPRSASTAIWGDAAVWVPWALWQAYGDLDALRRHYPAMLAHTQQVEALLSPSGLWDTGFQFGDWLDPTAPPERPFEAKADNGVVATACYIRTLAQATAAARLLEHTSDAEHFQALHERSRAAFTEHYLRPDGTLHSDSPTVYALAIAFEVLDPPARQHAGTRLAQLVRDNDFHVATGFAGTPFILDALTETGHLDVAYAMLTQSTCPSWLYPITMGATSIWERWDSMLPDGSINPGEMTSFNHYALGAVADWMHRTVGGLSPLAPGYAKARFAPRPGAGITSARTCLDTPHGRIETSWTVTPAGHLVLAADVPDGMQLELQPPGGQPTLVGGGHHTIAVPG